MSITLRLAYGFALASVLTPYASAQEVTDSYFAESAGEPAAGATKEAEPSVHEQVQAPIQAPVQALYGSCQEALCDNGCCCRPWQFNFSQTAGYGTNLALPITLTRTRA